jgi:predicted Ser/Thr protein kinase
MIGTVLSNRYKLIAELGSGGMAWVYLAEDLVEGQKVAVKVLYPQHSQDLGFLHRFIREAKLSMTLSQRSSQRNIVRVLDYGADRDTHYLVMEYVQGQDLGHILKKEGPLPWQEALDVARQVASALDNAHQLDIVHRDIKPSNIMVLPDGTVRVLDFGIARAHTSPDLTLSGFVGSPHYAAPEQTTGQRVDIRADIYSLGIVLYRMLSGSLPFQGDTPWAVVNQHIVSTPPPLRECFPGLPEHVIQLTEKAMARRPVDRFQTPNEMIQAIDAVLAGHDLPFEPLLSTAALPTPILRRLYQRAMEATEAERWQEAVDLFSQILRVDPDYSDVTDQLAEVGKQIRLAKLYRSAQRALDSGNWVRASAQLDAIAAIEPAYKDIQALRVRVENRQEPEMESDSPAFEFPTQIPSTDTGRAGSLAPVPAGPDPSPSQTAPPAEAPRRPQSFLWIGIPLLALVLALLAYFIFSGPQPASTPLAGIQPSPTARASLSVTRGLTAPVPSVTPSVQPPVTTPTPVAQGSTPTASATPTVTPTSATPTPTATKAPTLTPSSTPTDTPTPTRPAATIPLASQPPRGQIAFPRFDPNRGTYDIFACYVDGSNCRRLSTAASQPDFLPDGTQIVIHSWKTDEKGLILQTVAGERVWWLTGEIEAARPSVDFQGQRYVYHSRHEADRQPRLYRTYGSETRPIMREASVVRGQSPSWLPDGRILYSGCWLNSCGIIAMLADGTFPRQVVAGSTETNPESSPDGQQVALMSQRDGNWEIYIADVDGGNLQRLTNNPANDGLPTWSPDGRYIAFVTDRDGPWAVWLMRPDGSGKRRLFDIGGPLDGQVRDAVPYEIHGWVEERISWAPVP